MTNIPHLTGVHAQHVPHYSGLPMQSSIGQQAPQPYQASSHQPQQQYPYQNPAQQHIANTTSAQPNTGAGSPIVIDVKPTLRQADDQPWRYRGYPAMCRWMASDDDFFVIRKFGEVAARVLLRMQDRIVQLEEELHKQDQISAEHSLHSGTFRKEKNLTRDEIMDELTWRLKEYQRFALDHSQMKDRTEATKFQVSNVLKWIEGANKKVIEKDEQEFLQKDWDLIPVVPKARTPLRRFIDHFDVLRLPRCLRNRVLNQRLYSEEDFEMTSTVYSKDSLVDKLVTFITIFLGLGMLIGPLWWLQNLSNNENRLGVITGFLFIFTAILSILTVAKPFEVLAATAAYGALLMVFMQLGSNTGSAG